MLTLLLLVLLVICCFGPGFFLLGKTRLTIDERICGSVALSLVIVYLLAGAVYLTGINWHWCWLLTAGLLAMSAGAWPQLRSAWRRRQFRSQAAAFGMLLVIGLAGIAILEHYSGLSWGNDWYEHYQRSVFFSNRQPYDTNFLDVYALPARPPMTHLFTAYLMAHVGSGYESFQVITMFLNVLVFFPCVLLAGMLVRGGNRRVWLIAAFLATSPLFVQNSTYAWNKLICAFFVILSTALYVRAWRTQSPGRLIGAAGAMAAAMLVHYSAGPYAVFIGAHYLAVLAWRRHKLLELAGASLVTLLLLGTWFGWSMHVYGVEKTFKSNTAVADSQSLGAAGNALKVGKNVVTSLVPFPLRISPAAFDLAYIQPNRFGWFRDYFFGVFQTNLPGTLGLIGWLVAIWVIIRIFRRGQRRMSIFWGSFIILTTLLGIAVHGTEDLFGVAHICLQPLALMGLTLLAASFEQLRRWARLVLAVSIVAGVVLGVILQLRIEMLAIKPVWVNATHIIPLSSGLLNFQAVSNSAYRWGYKIPYLADHLTSIGWLILAVLLLAEGYMVWLISCSAAAAPAKPQRGAHGAWWAVGLVAVYSCGALLCVSDRLMGYRLHSITEAMPTTAQSQSIVQLAEHNARVDPGSPDARYGLAVALYQLGGLDDAHRAASDASLLDPDHAKARYLVGYLTIARKFAGGFDAAGVVYTRQMFDSANNQSAYTVALFKRGLLNKALEVATNAVEKYPSDAGSRNNLGAVLFQLGKPQEALEQVTQALRLDPGSDEQASQLRGLLIRLGKDPETADRTIREIRGSAGAKP